MLTEEDTMVLSAQPDQRRSDALKWLGRALAGERVTAQSPENLAAAGPYTTS
jgi:hypothetical protein